MALRVGHVEGSNRRLDVLGDGDVARPRKHGGFVHVGHGYGDGDRLGHVAVHALQRYFIDAVGVGVLRVLVVGLIFEAQERPAFLPGRVAGGELEELVVG